MYVMDLLYNYLCIMKLFVIMVLLVYVLVYFNI